MDAGVAERRRELRTDDAMLKQFARAERHARADRDRDRRDDRGALFLFQRG